MVYPRISIGDIDVAPLSRKRERGWGRGVFVDKNAYL
jgi:hypothetical protein